MALAPSGKLCTGKFRYFRMESGRENLRGMNEEEAAAQEEEEEDVSVTCHGTRGTKRELLKEEDYEEAKLSNVPRKMMKAMKVEGFDEIQELEQQQQLKQKVSGEEQVVADLDLMMDQGATEKADEGLLWDQFWADEAQMAMAVKRGRRMSNDIRCNNGNGGNHGNDGSNSNNGNNINNNTYQNSFSNDLILSNTSTSVNRYNEQRCSIDEMLRVLDTSNLMQRQMEELLRPNYLWYCGDVPVSASAAALASLTGKHNLFVFGQDGNNNNNSINVNDNNNNNNPRPAPLSSVGVASTTTTLATVALLESFPI